MSESFDVIIIGSGPGGYVCAIRAAQLGLKTACVEKRATLGGTCLNIGCIPSKALLQSSEEFEKAAHALKDHGILIDSVKLDLAKMQASKQDVVTANTKGVEFLFRKNKVTWLKGTGKITAPGQIDVDGTAYTAKNIVIATGSESVPLPGVTVDEKQIVTSTGALELDKVPGHLVVIGGGVIGLELGSVWQRLGAKVTVVEFLDRIALGMDTELATNFQRILQKQGMTFRLGSKVTGATTGADGVALTVEPVKGGAAETLKADIVLVAIGRRPYTEGLGLDTVGVALDERKRIKVDGHWATNVPGIYAIGDVIAGPMLAHKGEEEGVAIAERLAGQAGHVNYDAIPSVVYTWPEVASVGKTEDELKAAGVAYSVGKFPFTANGRARAMGDTDGFVKLLADKTTDRLLGAHILGPDAGHLIAELTLAIEFGASAEDVARTCHAHPTLSEAVKEAALAVDKRALHI
ncbi:MAG TPA: dihydrolipoyl dehydrogenase [Rhodopila sp.]|uniref:dihydrolipoyl dehydrogenase n=1 Tax=Rhodopila sp. TaxID=2480087 RepID=UPI002C6B8030|nr:dihydrolipoyl dehydrogenase [Rhodopila sp.]HVY18067.1 dihydrolipoyl dehydrogenase [Rhodopila sp.]